MGADILQAGLGAADRAGQVNGPGVEQELFRQCALASVGMRNDGERPTDAHKGGEVFGDRVLRHERAARVRLSGTGTAPAL